MRTCWSLLTSGRSGCRRALQERAPQLTKDSEGGDGWLYAGSTEPDPIGLTATPGMAWDKFRWKGVTYDEARPGCYDGGARLEDMTIDGVDAEVIFPPQRTIGHFLGDDDDDFMRAGIDAYNDFLWEEFSGPDHDRLIGAAQMPSSGVEDSVVYLQKAVARGFKTVVISNWPSGGEQISDEDDEFWAAAAEAGIPVCIHINLISRATRQRNRKAAATPAAERCTAARARPALGPRSACPASSRWCRRSSGSSSSPACSSVTRTCTWR